MATKTHNPSVTKTITIQFNTEPIAYARERFTKFGGAGHGRFYNPRASVIDAYNKAAKAMLSDEDRSFLDALIDDKTADYQLEISGKFYVAIPKSAPEWKKKLMEDGSIRPCIRPDVDNFIKLILDAMHGVLYEDDKRVVSISSNKFYSESPRTELTVKVSVFKN